MICWVRIDERVGYGLIESGYFINSALLSAENTRGMKKSLKFKTLGNGSYSYDAIFAVVLYFVISK